MKTSVLKPGYLVSLKTTLRGGVNYRRVDLETERTTDDGALRAKWETTREIPDPDEYARAVQARSDARGFIVRECCASAFGMLCPTSNEGALQDAIQTARQCAADFNATARQSQIGVYVLIGRIAQDDAEAARAIGTEIKELLEQMQTGIREADPAAIREAANKARSLGGMLSLDVAGKVSQAIEEARRAARAIVARVEKAGETAAAVVAECSTARIESARFAFLDLDEGAAVQTEAPAGRGIDLEPDAQPAAEAYAAPSIVRALELF